MMARDALTTFAERLGVAALDRTLLEQALTHTSYAFEHPGTADNERLELLGDAVLDLAVTAELFARDPDAAEGVLSRRRAALVREASLADVARSVGLGDVLRLGRGEEGSGGADKDSLLADALEAVLGAVYVDGGHRPAAELALRLLAGAFARLADQLARGETDAEDAGGLDPKTALQERAAALGMGAPDYRTERTGPPHDPRFDASVVIDGVALGSGSGRSKKEASQAAAAEALRRAPGAGSLIG